MRFRIRFPASSSLLVITALFNGCGVGVLDVSFSPSVSDTGSHSTGKLSLVDAQNSSIDGATIATLPPRFYPIFSLLQEIDGSSSRPVVRWSISDTSLALVSHASGKSAEIYPVRTGEFTFTITDLDSLLTSSATVSVRPKVSFLGATRPLITQWSQNELAPMSTLAADGFLSNAQGSTIDASGIVYVADTDHNRISRYSASTGAYLGSIGRVDTSSGTCNSNGTSNAWCMGGNFLAGANPGNLSTPSGVALSPNQTKLYVADTGNSRINVYDRASGAYLSQLPISGLNQPRSLTLDSAGNLYIVDTLNSRIRKFDSSGIEVGWIGKIGTQPTGGAAGCNGAAVNTFTPGWCLGGAALAGISGGMLNYPFSIVVDPAGKLYVADSANHRINRYDAASGAYLGSIGRVAIAGGNCATIGPTASWCSGATFGMESTDGAFNSPNGLALDATTDSLYVADSSNHRLSQYTLSTGAFVGSLGKTSASNGSCPSGSAALRWCRGGVFVADSTDGGYTFPRSIALAPDGGFVVMDQSNQRLVRLQSTGAFVGAVGGSANLRRQPGWGLVQLSASTSDDLGFSSPSGVAADSTYLYVTDSGNSRVKKIRIATGELEGSIGYVITSGGTCTSIGVTAGWCKGGTFSSSSQAGGMSNAAALTLFAGKLFVSDYGNHRINRYHAETGAYEGTIGSTANEASTQFYEAGGITPTASSSINGGINTPTGIVIDSNANKLYILSSGNNCVNRYDATTGAFDFHSYCSLSAPYGIAFAPSGNHLVVSAANMVYVLDLNLTSVISSFGASGMNDGQFFGARGLAFDARDYLYVADSGSGRIQRFKWSGTSYSFTGWFGMVSSPPSGGDAGCTGTGVKYGTTPWAWCSGSPGQSAAMSSTSGMGLGGFYTPGGLTTDTSGNLYVADIYNHRVVRVNTQ